MMMRKSTVAALSILVAVATAHPYAEWNSARYRWNDLFAATDEEVGARVRSQTTVEMSSCATVNYTETRNGKSRSYSVRVCSVDPEDYPNKVCLGTIVKPCCRDEDFSLLSSEKIGVAGEDVTVEFYLTPAEVCFRLDDAHQKIKTCSQRLKNDSCLPECSGVTPPLCFNNTLNGSSSCVGDGCQCKTGYLSPNCCQCDTTNFYSDGPDCRPFCRGNCSRFRPVNLGGCLTCRAGFTGAPECCLPQVCDKNQTLYFYIDATTSNEFDNFCPLMVVLQMLVAAFNPSATSGTQIGALLFSDNANNRPPSPVFDVGTSCFDAVQGSNMSLRSLITDFGACIDHTKLNPMIRYNSTLFPSLCGEGTSAVKGLEEILLNLTSSTKKTTEKAILMLTDGIINDDEFEEEPEKVINKLNSMGITLIAAGFNDADSRNLGDYTGDNIVIKDNVTKLGVAIVRRLEERGIICKDHADNITATLENAQGDATLNFCTCHRKKLSDTLRKNCARRTIKYPTCGGDVSIGIPLIPTQEQELDSLILEKEILAAVESVLERFKG